MAWNLNEGELVDLPCRHCVSLTLKVTARAGEHDYPCWNCGGTTRVRFGRDDKGFSVSSWAVIEEAPDES